MWFLVKPAPLDFLFSHIFDARHHFKILIVEGFVFSVKIKNDLKTKSKGAGLTRNHVFEALIFTYTFNNFLMLCEQKLHYQTNDFHKCILRVKVSFGLVFFHHFTLYEGKLKKNIFHKSDPKIS